MGYAYTNSKGATYYLHTKQVALKGGGERPFYYFAKEPRAGEVLDTVPKGYDVSETSRSGLPVLKKKEEEGRHP